MRNAVNAGLIVLVSLFSSGVLAQKQFRWCVFYGASAQPDAFQRFDLLVFDSDKHPPLPSESDRRRIVLGYLSLGEIESYRSWFQEVKAEGILLRENVNWKGSFYVDVRDSRWADRVAGRLLPSILDQGFHGVFLDTLDNCAELERSDPEAFGGMKQAAAELVHRIRRSNPGIKIMMNRGYEILPLVESSIDYELGESVAATFDFASRKYRWVAEDDRRVQVELLLAARRRAPQLRLLTLDYWDPRDQGAVRAIYRMERRLGFDPYVATIELDRLQREP